jgi:Fe(3+) dicitrate transport protein
VIRNRQLERFEYDDAHAILSTVPGVYSRGEDGMGLRPNIGLRGVNPDRSKKVTLMEDGVLFGPAPYSAPAAYYFPLMTRMTGVRVIKGPGAVSYGPQTVGGAIDFITRPIPGDASGQIDVAGGQYGYKKLDAYYGFSDGKIGFLIEGVHLSNTGFKHLPQDTNTGFYRNEALFKGSYVLDPNSEVKNEFRIKLGFSYEVSNETYLGLSDADFREDPLQRYEATMLDRMRNYRTTIVLSHTIEPSRRLSIVSDAYRHDYYRIWRKVNGFRGASLFDVLRDPTSPRNEVYHSVLTGESDSSNPQETLLIGPNQREFTSQGIQSRLHWSAPGIISQRLEAGARFHNDRIDRRHSEDGFVLIEGEPYPEGTATTVTALNTAWTYALALHAVDAISYKSLTLTPGARFELIRSGMDDDLAGVYSTRWDQVLLPGIGAFFGITDQMGILGGVYRGFSPPEPGSGDTVKPELSVNYEAGARFVIPGVRLEAIGFYNDYQNLTDVCTFSSGCEDTEVDRQFDAGKARIYGLEAFADVEAPLGAGFKAPLVIAYTLTHSEFQASFTSNDPIFGSVKKGDEMPYVPRHQLTVTPGLEHELAGGNLSFRYVSAMREEAGSEPLSESLSTDAQFTVDASAYCRPLSFLEIYVSGQNLFNEHYLVSRRPFGARPNAPRWLQLGAKLKF